jgi:Glycine-zipper domain
MKSSFFIIALMGSWLLAQGQTNPPAPQPQTGGAMQQPGATQPQPAEQQSPQQQSAPAGQPPATMPQQGAPTGQQPASGAQPPGDSNVASTLHVYAYPKANQPPDKQFKDETECYQSAQTAAPAEGQQAAQQGQSSNAGKGSTAKGTAGGAATGAAIGGVAGDAGKGAAIGAVGGAAVGHRKKKKAQGEAEKQKQQQEQAQQAQVTDNVKRAYTACMEARNYVVK